MILKVASTFSEIMEGWRLVYSQYVKWLLIKANPFSIFTFPFSFLFSRNCIVFSQLSLSKSLATHMQSRACALFPRTTTGCSPKKPIQGETICRVSSFAFRFRMFPDIRTYLRKRARSWTGLTRERFTVRPQ